MPRIMSSVPISREMRPRRTGSTLSSGSLSSSSSSTTLFSPLSTSSTVLDFSDDKALGGKDYFDRPTNLKNSFTPGMYNHDLNDDGKKTKRKGTAFSLAEPKTPISRSMSPSPIATPPIVYPELDHGNAGTAPDEFYAAALAPWRAAARKFVMRNLQKESEYLAKMQQRIRTPWLDTYFLYSSSLGTHTFFMTMLPALFFFGFSDMARGLVFVLGMGVYASSFIKDLMCAPRPYTPPVTRLTMGSHHLEYGFPSTHTTNSVSVALFIYSVVHQAYFTSETISTLFYTFSTIFLLFYTFSIVFGRLYTGMHSLTDCVAGFALGAVVWAVHAEWWLPVEKWMVSINPDTPSLLPHWTGPIAMLFMCIWMVHRHPQPVDDCPCFEDAIAFVSVITGLWSARWGSVVSGFSEFTTHMAGRALPFMSADAWASSEAWAIAWRAASLWWGMALLKLTIGITIIFVWRLAAKYILHMTLPPLFRLLTYKILPRLVSINVLPQGSELPNRRFYTPATEYDGSVPEDGLRPIPSVIDLPLKLQESTSTYELDGEAGGMVRRRIKQANGKKRHRVLNWEKVAEKNGHLIPPDMRKQPTTGTTSPNELSLSDDEDIVKHYDADVATKVIVYSGIGALAGTGIPLMFEILGWGVHP